MKTGTLLLEAAYNRYLAMFNPIIKKVIEPMQNSDVADPEISQMLEKVKTQIIPWLVRWAIEKLKKQDRVTWFLRLARVVVLNKISFATYILDERGLLAEFANRIYEKERDNWYSTIETIDADSVNFVSSVIGSGVIEEITPTFKIGSFISTLNHFFTQDIPTIQEMSFPSNIAPNTLIDELNNLQVEWYEKQSRFIDFETQRMESEPEVLIQYKNGAQWLNLHKPSCDLEARAMGHCGNSASGDYNETILSFRTIEKHPQKKKKMWVPHLTFILDTGGYLGEMKGRNNQKPDKKYHGVIYDLLKLPTIRGIKGGGYLPENNFRLQDFPEEVAENLMDEKPELASLEHIYRKEGASDALIEKMKQTIVNSMGAEKEPGYSSKRDMFFFMSIKYQTFWSRRFSNVAMLMNALQNKSIAGSMSPSIEQLTDFIMFLPPSALKELYTAISLYLGDWESIVQFIGPEPDAKRLAWFFKNIPVSRVFKDFIINAIEMIFVNFSSEESVQNAFKSLFLGWIEYPSSNNVYNARFFRTSKDNFNEIRLAVPSREAVKLVTKLDENDRLSNLDSWFDELNLVDISLTDILDAMPKAKLQELVRQFENGIEVYNNRKRKDKRVL